MKIKLAVRIQRLFPLLAGSLLLLVSGVSVRAANIPKLDTTSLFTNTVNWVLAPGGTDVGEFNSTPSAATLTGLTLQGTNIILAGLLFDNNMNGPVTIASGGTLTLGTSGINMTGANQNVTINCAVACGTSAQTWNVVSGKSLTVGTSVAFGSGGSLTLAGAGTISLPGLNTGNGTGTIGVTMTGGSFTGTDVNIGKTGSTTTTVPTATGPFAAPANAGFYVSGSGATVSLNTLELSTQNGGCSGLISAGSTTVSGVATIGASSSGARGSYFQVSGGSFTVNDTASGVVMSPNKGSTVNLSEFYVSGGTATVGKLSFGASTDTAGGTAWLFVDGGSAALYVGSGGIVRATPIGSYSANISLLAGLLGATGDWTNSVPMQLSGPAGTPFTIQAADASSVTHNIALNGAISGTGSMTKTGGGILTLSGANTFTGNTAINAGVVNAGVSEVAGTTGPFGVPATVNGSIAFGGGTLQYSANNHFDYSGRFATSGNEPISIDTAGQTVTFGTALTSSGGTLTLTNSTGSGKLILTAANTYSGATTNNGGTLAVNGSLAGNVVVNSGGLLGGNGTISGTVIINSGGGLAPGNGVGTNTVGSLTLNAGSTNNFEFNSNPANDQTIVTTPGGLAINGGMFNLYTEGSTTAWTVPGTYNLIQYNGAINGGGLDSTWTTASSLNPHIANSQPGFTYRFGTSGGWLTLTIVSSANNGSWGVDSDGNWSFAGNWTGFSGSMPPRNAEDLATFGTGTAKRTVTLDANETAGKITMNNNNSFVIASAGKTLTLDDSGFGALVNVTAGTQNAIQTAVSLNDNATVTVGGSESLAVSGNIANTGSSKTLTVNGTGTLALSGNNTYGPPSGSIGTILSSGTLQVGNNNALGTGILSVPSSGTLQAGTTGLSLGNEIDIASGATVTVDNNGNNLTLGGEILDSGGLTKIGNGTLTVNAVNYYTGNTTVNGGVLSISQDQNVQSSAGLILNGGDLLGNNSSTLAPDVYEPIEIGPTSGNIPGTALIDAASGQIFSVYGSITSAGNTGANNLTVNSGAGNNGTVYLDNDANNFSGTTIISNGWADVASPLSLQDSTVNYNNQGGFLVFDGNNGVIAATLGGLAGAQNLGLTNLSGSGLTLTVGNNNGSNTYSGNMSDGGLGGALTKVGTGTLTLTGTNNYSGATTINGGAVQLNPNGVIDTSAANIASIGSAGLFVGGGFLTATNASNIGNPSAGLQVSSGSASFLVGLTTASSTSGTLINVTGGSLTAGSLTLGRTGLSDTTQPAAGDTGNGLYVNGGMVSIITNLNMGTATAANSSVSVRIDSGSLTVGSALTIGLNNGGRWSVVDVNGGTLTVTNATTGISVGGPFAGNAELLIRAGTVTAGIIGLGYGTIADSNVLNQTGGSLYVGGGGIVQVSSNALPTISLIGGVLGATADWFSTNNMLLGTATIQAADASSVAHNISLSGVLSGTNLVKTGAGTLTLSGVNTYSGSTTLNAGTLALTNNAVTLTDGSVGSSPNIVINSGSFLNVSGIANGTMPLSSSQTLGGYGTILGTLDATAGGTVSPGGGAGVNTGTLTVTNKIKLGSLTVLKLNRTNNLNCDRIVSPSITAGGTLSINNVGPALAAYDTFQLFSTPVSGTFSVTNLPALLGGMVWSNSLTVNGSITVVPTVFLPTQPPGITNFTLMSGTNVAISGTNGQSGDTYYLLASGNLTLSFNRWLAVATNVVHTSGASGAFTFNGTNVAAANGGQKYYILSNTNNR